MKEKLGNAIITGLLIGLVGGMVSTRFFVSPIDQMFFLILWILIFTGFLYSKEKERLEKAGWKE